MPRRSAAKKKPAADALSELADAVDRAAETTAAGSHEGEVSSGARGPAPGSLAHHVYAGSYLLTFGVMFPALMIGRSIRSNNPAARGAADGAGTARSKAERGTK